MATIKKITYKAQFGGKGFLDPKADPVADLAALHEKKAADLLPGMVCTVLNDGTDGAAHEYRYVSGTTWERCDKQLREAIAEKIDASALEPYATMEWVNEQGFLTAETEYTAGKGITIENHVISCTGEGKTYTAGDNIEITDDDVINVVGMPTKVSELANDAGYVTTDTTYSAGENIVIDTNNVISVTGMPDVSDFVTADEVEQQILEKEYVTSGDVENQIIEKEYITEGDVETILSEKNYTTSGDVKEQIEAYDYITDADLAGLFNAVEYVATAKTIYFYDKSDNQVGTIDTSTFVKDGMIDTVEVKDGYLIITFNTESGKEPISIPLTDFFDADDYYTKDEVEDVVDNAVSGKQDTLVSGTNIKTINNESLLGEGNIEITDTTYSAGDNITIDANNVISVTGIPDVSEFVTSADVESQIIEKEYVTSGDVENQIEEKEFATTAVVETMIENATSSIPTTFKTINSESIVGEGNIEIEGTSYTAGDNIAIDDNNIISVTGMPDVSEFVTSADVESQIEEKEFATTAVVETMINEATSSIPTTFKTINSETIIGEGDIEITDTTYSAGDNVAIDENNVISVTGITIPTNVSAFVNDAGYVTSDTTYTAGENVDIDADNVISVTGMPTAVSELVNDAGYVTSDTTYSAGENVAIDENNVISVTGITVPTLLSELTNDEGFITGYTQGDNITIANGTISATDTTYTAGDNVAIDEDNVISVTGITVPTNVSAFVNDAGYVTSDTTYSAGENVDIDANNVISVTGMPTAVSELTNDAGYITGYSAGTNITIENGTIAATDTTYEAGQNIEITNGNVINVTGITIPTNVSEFTNDAGYVTSDTTYAAGEFIKIEGANNAISVTGLTSAVLAQALTTDVAVGNVSAGTTFSAGTPIEDILIAIFKNTSVEPEHVTVNFSATGTGAAIADLENNATVTLTVDGSATTYTFDGNAVTFNVEDGKVYNLTFGNVNGYTAPSALTYTAESAYTRAVSATYEKIPAGEASYYSFYVNDFDQWNDILDESVADGHPFELNGDEMATATTFTQSDVLNDFTNNGNPESLFIGGATTAEKVYTIPGDDEHLFYCMGYVFPQTYQVTDIIDNTTGYSITGSPFYLRQNLNINGVAHTAYTFANDATPETSYTVRISKNN